jgi:predicted HTH transcriptional regulator
MLESQSVEFKREYNDKVNKTMLAFLNTEGGALYLGMDDDGSVYGLDGETDEEHPITITQIIERLNAEGFSANRHTVMKDIATLEAHGVAVVCNRSRQSASL